MKNRLAATLLFLAVLMAAPLFAESKAQKMEALVQEASVKKIKNMIVKNQSLAEASYGQSKDSLLIVALKSNRGYDVIKLLLDAGVNPKMQNADGDNAIVYAAKCGADAKILDELISYDTVLPFQRKNRILKKNNEGMSALDYAAQSNNSEQISVINHYLGIVDEAAEEPVVESAAEPEPVAETPAAAEPAPEVIAAAPVEATEPVPEPEPVPATTEILPPPNGEDLQKAAAEAAARAQRPNRRVYLFEGITAFDTYDVKQKQRVALIDQPNKVGPNGRTLLQKAAAQDDLDMIGLLKESKADFNLADREGYTPLMYAARFAKKPETVALLFAYGADAKAKNRFGLSAIEIAAADNKNAQIVESLLAKSQKVDSKKAFVAAVGIGRPNDVIQKFLDAGMSANEIYKGKSLLMYAAESNSDTDCIEFLLEKGADKTMLSNDWKDAYWFASQNPSLPHNNVYWSLNNAEKN